MNILDGKHSAYYSSTGTCSNSGIVQESHPPSPISLQRKSTYDYIQDLFNTIPRLYTEYEPDQITQFPI